VTSLPRANKYYLDSLYEYYLFIVLYLMRNKLYTGVNVIKMFMQGLYPTAEAFFICLAVNLLICNIAVSFGKTKSHIC